jgi:glyoxylase-like metal-dependent hydrolase (beta-lactamase superfamily II)
MATILGGRPAYWVAAYLVDGLLVDTGRANTAPELLAALEAEASAGYPVRTVVNTHYHEDHVGANRLVRERFGARILAHPRAVPLIAGPGAIPDYRVLVWGRPEGALAEPAGDAIATARYRFLVVDTPGHCRGHLSLIEPERGWCFTGDSFVGEQPRVAWRERLASPLAWSRGSARSRSSPGPEEGPLTRGLWACRRRPSATASSEARVRSPL